MLRRALLIFVVAALAGCGGGGVSSLPSAQSVAASSGVRVSAAFVVTIPRASTAAQHQRAPRYVSPATQSLGITIDAGTANQSFHGQNIGSGAPGCNNPTPVSPLTCTVQITVTPGAHTFDFRTYDGTLDGNGNPQGNQITVPGTWPHTAQPNAIAFDPASGYVYVYDTNAAALGYANNVTVYDQNGNEIAMPASFAGAQNGWGMTIVP